MVKVKPKNMEKGGNYIRFVCANSFLNSSVSQAMSGSVSHPSILPFVFRLIRFMRKSFFTCAINNGDIAIVTRPSTQSGEPIAAP
jgi:hypothetical protein